MACLSSDCILRQVGRLLNLGTVGGMTDAQLLDWFITRQDEVAETAFEELMIRHGPMVFRVCRSVLLDTHDAEDAFQATFLVFGASGELNSPARIHRKLAIWRGAPSCVACEEQRDAPARS